jgi:hypothetical protein
MMKKLLLLIMAFSCAINLTFAQPVEREHYYYDGKKVFFPISYEQVVIALKDNQPVEERRTEIAILTGKSKDSILLTATKHELTIRYSSANRAAAISAIQLLLKKSYVKYARGGLLSTSGKTNTYGDEFVVKLKPGITVAAMQQLIDNKRCKFLKQYAFDNRTFIISADVFNGYDALKMANLFFESGLFEYAEPDFTLHNGLHVVPTDPLYNLQWALKNTGSVAQYSGTVGADMNLEAAWDITMGSPSITVAVIDEGVELAHPDLAANMIQGYDCTTLSSGVGDGAPKSTARAHGTNCAGIIAARTDTTTGATNIGIAGIAPFCKIMPINLAVSGGSFASNANIATGFDYAWQNGAHVISNSWGGGTPSSVMRDAINRAYTLGRGGKGCVILFSSGNANSGVSSPATLEQVIAVGGVSMCNQRKSSTSCDGETFWGASYGTTLDVIAPAVKIATTDITGTGGYNTTAGAAGDYNNTFNGTSSACPNAAGVVALILSLDNNYTAIEVKNILESSCTKLSGYAYAMAPYQPNGTWNVETGHGRVNALAALQLTQSGIFCNVTISAVGSTRLCPGGTVTLEVTNPVGGTTYQWKKDGIDVSIGTSLVATTSGTYTVTATAINSCVANSLAIAVTVLNNTPSLVANAGADRAICPSTSTKLGGTFAATGGSPDLKDKRVFGFDWFTNALVKFNLTNPDKFDTVATSIVSSGDFSSNYVPTGGTFTPYGYYIITQGTNKLIKIDTATGTQTLIGTATPSNGSWSGLSWDKTTQNLYAVSSFGTNSRLSIINPLTAAVISTITISLSNIYSLSCDNSGNLFVSRSDAVSSTFDYVYQINKTTGAATALPSTTGFSINFSQDADVDPVTNKLYLTAFTNFGRNASGLIEVNTTTGAGTLIGPLGGYSEIDAAAIAGNQYTYAWSPATGLSHTNVAVPVASPTTTTTYTLTVTDMCGNMATDDVVVTVNTNGTWIGSNNAWTSASNWCGGTPISTTDVVIKSDASVMPEISSGSITIKNLTIETGSSLNLAGGTLNINGAIDGNGTISTAATSYISIGGTNGGSAGTLKLTPGSNTLRSLTLIRTGASPSLTLGNAINLTETLDVSNGTLNTNGHLTLKSNATQTAVVAPVGATASISGNVNIERYLSNKRAWRFLTTPLSNTGTVFANWQNNGAVSAGQGVEIWGPGGTGSGGNGLVAAPNYSLKMFNETSGNFDNITNTISLPLSTNNASAANKAFVLFSSGSYGSSNIATGSSATTLTASGALQTGNQIFNVANGTLENISLIGNPYASPVDFGLINRNNVNNKFWVWDAALTGSYGLGNYATGTWDGVSAYVYAPSNGKVYQYIQSGEAIFVESNAGGASITFEETDKVTNDLTSIFRTGNGSVEQLAINLNVLTNGSSTLLDGTTAIYHNNYSAGPDAVDAIKFEGSGENISLLRGSRNLAIEARPLIDYADTLFIKVKNLQVKDYHLIINASNFATDANLHAFLKDAFLGTETAISLTATTTINFTVTSNTASAANQRFMIVFRTASTLPVTLTTVKAYVQQSGINVEWNTANETDMKQFEVEKSANGRNFSSSTIVLAKNAVNNSYVWFDASPFKDNNYYRIKAIGNNGEIKYSSIVLVKISAQNAPLIVFPNPIKNGMLYVDFGEPVHEPKAYTISTADGKIVQQGFIMARKQTFLLHHLAAGVYSLKAGNKKPILIVKE